jgi:Flp pilus assembly protein TadG
MIAGIKSLIGRIQRDRRGSTFVLAAFMSLAFAGFAGISVDFAYLFQAERVLQAATDAAALAGAQKLSTSPYAANLAATSYVSYNALPNGLSGSSSVTTVNCSGTHGSTCTLDLTTPNGIEVRESANVPTFFGRAFGVSSVPVSATSYALASGGIAQNADIMLVVDTTGSMNSTDNACHATREDCAMNGLRTMLGGFNPAVQNVGLMVFPGLGATSGGGGHHGGTSYTAAQNAAFEYDCSSSTPSSSAVAAYNASPLYTLVGLSNDYRSGSSLNTSSDLVISARGGASGCTAGITAYGGVGTFYADAVTAAKTYLTANGRANANKFVVLLSDGDASASSSNMPSGEASNQCYEGYQASQAAQTAGMTVITIGYGSPTSGCSTDSSTHYTGYSYARNNPCGTLLAMASVGGGSTSAPQWFYSDSASGCSGGNSANNLSAIFTAIGTQISSGGVRLIPSS